MVLSFRAGGWWWARNPLPMSDERSVGWGFLFVLHRSSRPSAHAVPPIRNDRRALFGEKSDARLSEARARYDPIIASSFGFASTKTFEPLTSMIWRFLKS